MLTITNPKFNNKNAKFIIEECYITIGVKDLLINNFINTLDLLIMIKRHQNLKDDNKSIQDQELNQEILKFGGQIISVYKMNGYKFYINSHIEEPNTKYEERRATETTIMLYDEY